LLRLASGFTLVEILVVIAIIIVLAAILLPVYEVATKRAESASCLSNMRNIGIAARIYADDNDEGIIPARVPGAPPGYFGIGWGLLLQPYMRSEAILVCTSDPDPTIAADTYGAKRSYGINYEVTMVGGYNNSSLCLADISDPTQVILFFEIASNLRRLGMSYKDDGLSAVAPRHREGSNYTFVDAHAKWLRTEQTISPNNLWSPQ